MLRTGNITEDTMISLNIVTDCCYAWNIMESFIDTMQTSIKESPPTVIKLKALFLKVNSIATLFKLGIARYIVRPTLLLKHIFLFRWLQL